MTDCNYILIVIIKSYKYLYYTQSKPTKYNVIQNASLNANICYKLT